MVPMALFLIHELEWRAPIAGSQLSAPDANECA